MVKARLVPEPTKRYDPNAVKVEVDGTLVGYMARDQAKAYRQLSAGSKRRMPPPCATPTSSAAGTGPAAMRASSASGWISLARSASFGADAGCCPPLEAVVTYRASTVYEE